MKAKLCGMIMFGLLLGTVRPAAAQDSTQALYKSKCQICHGPDATGSVPGKKLGVKDFQTPEVQKQPDSELLEVAKKGKNKMPAYDGKLTNNQLTDLIKFMRGLAKEAGKGK
jgi:mono/diheme cytochrome c family protein